MMEGQVRVGPIYTTQERSKTGNPLVIKGVERIEAVNIPGNDVRRDAELYSHYISRVMRRDFNLTSVKLYWYTKGYNRRQNARRMLQDLVAEAGSLEDMARPYEMPGAEPAATCTMRIISDEADLLFDALITADRALYKLMHSPLSDVVEENASPFMRSFTTLRKAVFGFQGDQRQQPAVPDISED